MDLLLKQEVCLQAHTGNMSGLLEPPGGDPLCIYLLRDGGAGEGRREVACQWESPEEETKEVGCQWESPEEQKRDAAVQVDLLMQQLSWTRTGDQLRAAGISHRWSVQHLSVCFCFSFTLVPFGTFWETHTRYAI